MFVCENCLRAAGMGDFELMTTVRSSGVCEVKGASCIVRGVCYDVHHSRFPKPKPTPEQEQEERRVRYLHVLRRVSTDLEQLLDEPMPTFSSILIDKHLAAARHGVHNAIYLLEEGRS